MNPLKLIRKLGKLLRGGSTSRQMFLAVFFGFAVGMTPGVNLTLLIFIACAEIQSANSFRCGIAEAGPGPIRSSGMATGPAKLVRQWRALLCAYPG